MARFLRRLLTRLLPRYAENAAFRRYFALYQRGAYREAYVALRDIMRDYPRWNRMGDLYVWCAGLELTLNDDVSAAGDLLNTALRLGCQDLASYHRASGHVFWWAGDHESGIRDLEKAVALEPSAVNLLALGGSLSFAADERAMDICQPVLQQEPQNRRAHIYLGILAARTGDNGKALAMAKRAEELQPTACELQEIARLYAEAGEISAALDRFLQADQLGAVPKGPLHARIAACYFELGKTREGRTHTEQARRCNPNSASVKEVWEAYKERCAHE